MKRRNGMVDGVGLTIIGLILVVVSVLWFRSGRVTLPDTDYPRGPINLRSLEVEGSQATWLKWIFFCGGVFLIGVGGTWIAREVRDCSGGTKSMFVASVRESLKTALITQALPPRFLGAVRPDLVPGIDDQLIALVDEWLDHGLGAQVLGSTTDLSYLLMADNYATDSLDEWLMLRETTEGRAKVLEMAIHVAGREVLIDYRRKFLAHSALRIMSQSPFMPLSWTSNILDDRPLTDIEAECGELFDKISKCFLKRKAFGALSTKLTSVASRLQGEREK